VAIDPISIGISILLAIFQKTRDRVEDRLAERFASIVVPDANTQGASEELAVANKNLADALNKIKSGTATPDTQWQAVDGLFTIAKEKPEWLQRTEELLKQYSPPHFDFAKNLSTTLQPAIEQSENAKILLSQVGPKPTQPSTAQLFALPEFKKLDFPEEIKSIEWPQNTKFVWPSPMKLPESPVAFTFPGQLQTQK
jgi:hypothetical protein